MNFGDIGDLATVAGQSGIQIFLWLQAHPANSALQSMLHVLESFDIDLKNYLDVRFLILGTHVG
jgi:hypothetical protein